MTPTHSRPRWLLAFLTVGVVIGLAALVLSVQNALALDEQADQRERERVAADVAACERGNLLREQIVDGHQANDELVSGILDTFLAPFEQDPERADDVVHLRAALRPSFERYRDIVTTITPTDCDALVGTGEG